MMLMAKRFIEFSDWIVIRKRDCAGRAETFPAPDKHTPLYLPHLGSFLPWSSVFLRIR